MPAAARRASDRAGDDFYVVHERRSPSVEELKAGAYGPVADIHKTYVDGRDGATRIMEPRRSGVDPDKVIEIREHIHIQPKKGFDPRETFPEAFPETSRAPGGIKIDPISRGSTADLSDLRKHVLELKR